MFEYCKAQVKELCFDAHFINYFQHTDVIDFLFAGDRLLQHILIQNIWYSYKFCKFLTERERQNLPIWKIQV